MKGKQLLAALLASACVLTASGCAAKSASVENLMKDTKKEQTESLYDTSVVQDTATALTGFGTALLQNAMVEANPLVSPLSVASALSMTANGALGETKTQMEQALGADTGSLNAYFSGAASVFKGQPADEACQFHLDEGHGHASYKRRILAAERKRLWRRDLFSTL